MRLLDRYLLRELLLPLAYCLCGFLIFWIGFDLLSDMDRFQRAHLHIGQVAHYYVLKMPELMVTVLPVALLLAMLYTLTNHARHNEIVAIRAAGVSVWRLSVPYLAVGFVASALLLMVVDFWYPDSSQAAEEMLETREKGALPTTKVLRNLNFQNESAQRSWAIGAYDPDLIRMTNAVIEWPLPGGGRRFISAQTVEWSGGHWILSGVSQFIYQSAMDPTPQMEQFPQVVAEDLTETPKQIESEIRISSLNNPATARKVRLSIGEIYNYLRLHPKLQGPRRALVSTQLHGRLAEPWLSFVVVLVSIPFGAATSGRRNVLVGVASSLGICFAYFVLSRFGIALGTGGILPGWLAAWLPNMFFGALGVFLIWRIR